MTDQTTAESWVECGACEGRGQINTDCRWAGEAYGEPVSRWCPDCHGEGGWEEEVAP